MTSFAQVEHHIGDPLAGAVIGILPAAPGMVHRKAGGNDEIGIPGAGAGRIERGVLEEPDQFWGVAPRNVLRFALHPGEPVFIGYEAGRHLPAGRQA